MTEYHDHRDDCPFKFATLDVCDCVEKNMLDRIEALTANLAKAVEGLDAVVQHEASTFFGPDGEKNKRASWRGVMRKIRATLAEIKRT